MTDKKARSLQRVLEIAAQTFVQQPFESVSVGAIAEAAHCSTATIYDIYRSKQELFLAAISHALYEYRSPHIVEKGNEISLRNLFLYAEARTRFLSSPEYRNIRRAVKSQAYLTAPLEREFASQQHDLVMADLMPEVISCCEADLLRPLPPKIITRNIAAGVFYAATVHEVMLGGEEPIKFDEVIRFIFTPLVSPQGERQLADFLLQSVNSAASIAI
ncbi:MAG: TetR/AcrR family transcriptional regulator [Verrucomicrobiaceae bacterium]|nr:TetR/AcrR family transcriptional regulator [Verrucomicrobiaceae bacterium]